jgi:hypothetical protein
MVGEIRADFFDDIEDPVGTGRGNVVWERKEAPKLRRWANEKIKNHAQRVGQKEDRRKN